MALHAFGPPRRAAGAGARLSRGEGPGAAAAAVGRAAGQARFPRLCIHSSVASCAYGARGGGRQARGRPRPGPPRRTYPPQTSGGAHSAAPAGRPNKRAGAASRIAFARGPLVSWPAYSILRALARRARLCAPLGAAAAAPVRARGRRGRAGPGRPCGRRAAHLAARGAPLPSTPQSLRRGARGPRACAPAPAPAAARINTRPGSERQLLACQRPQPRRACGRAGRPCECTYIHGGWAGWGPARTPKRFVGMTSPATQERTRCAGARRGPML